MKTQEPNKRTTKIGATPFIMNRNAKRTVIQICLLCTILLHAITGRAQAVTSITAGKFHSLFLKSDGSLWAMGDNEYGQLGDGTYSQTNRPEQIVPTNVTAVASGLWHTLFLKNDGSLWAMGYNYFAELGDGTYNQTNRPEQIVASNVTAIATGAYHSLFLESDGSLWAMGYNGYGQLGDGTFNETNRPEQIVASNVTAIAAGGHHSLFLKRDGSLWAMGYNLYGQLGDGTYYTNAPYGTNQPEQIEASNVTAIATGAYYSLFLKSDGSLWAMGDNEYGQLGDGTYSQTNRPEQIVPTNVTAVAAGWYHSLYLKRDGSLWAVGHNAEGQLGDGSYSTNAPYGVNVSEQIVAGNVTAIAGGGDHSLFLRNDGSLWAMGDNSDGQLGDGTTDNGNYSTNFPEQIVAGPSGYNQLSVQILADRDVRLTFVGIAFANYTLDRSLGLAPPNWVPQMTNSADSAGSLVLTNTPYPSTNNFWRMRSVP